MAGLFEPTDPGLHDLVAAHGPVAAWHLPAEYDLAEYDRDVTRLRAGLDPAASSDIGRDDGGKQ